jgi:hypothetical protein
MKVKKPFPYFGHYVGVIRPELFPVSNSFGSGEENTPLHYGDI